MARRLSVSGMHLWTVEFKRYSFGTNDFLILTRTRNASIAIKKATKCAISQGLRTDVSAVKYSGRIDS